MEIGMEVDMDMDAPKRLRYEIKVSLRYPTLAYLLNRAETENIGLESLASALLDDAMHEPEPLLPQRALKQALEHVKTMKPGHRFTLPELFSDEDWTRIPSRRGFGKQFKNAVESGPQPLAKHVDKTVANMAIYERCPTTKDI